MTPEPYLTVAGTLQRMPILRPLLMQIYERRFSRNCRGCFRGVYNSFGEANLSAPENKPLGFNCPEYAQEFRDRLNKVFSFDYPMLFWLKCLLAEGSRIFDYGGHAGTHFYAYSRYLRYPPDMSWVVCDLPEMTRAGIELARREKKKEISFTTQFEDAAGADILIAAGSLQYVESPPLSASLAKLERKPTHLLINKLPLYGGEQYVTLQNGGAAFHPQYVFNRKEFVASLTSLGYSLMDSWDVETHRGYIPFHPEKSFPCHTGLYLTLDPRRTLESPIDSGAGPG
jgi:putative methyltransferase (TIGR04325 family)